MIYLFLAGRILFGGYFLMNAYNHLKNSDMLAGYAQSKGVSMPKASVILTGLMLLLGGAGVLLGVYVECALALLALFLVGVTFQMHKYWKEEDPMMRMGERINFYKNLGLLGGVLMLYAVPLPWALALV